MLATRKVQFCTEVKIFFHKPDHELDLIRYRNRNKVSWPASFHLRYEQLLKPILGSKFRGQILTRNLLAEAAYLVEQQLEKCKAVGTITH
jgi:hypothetical protein